MTLRDLASRHAKAILGSTRTGWAEDVTWRFKSGAPERTFAAVVKRLDLQPATPSSRATTRRRVQIEIPRDDVAGVTAITKGDTVLCVTREGEDPVECQLVRVVSQDSALFVVEVEA